MHNMESPINLACIHLECGRKPEDPENPSVHRENRETHRNDIYILPDILAFSVVDSAHHHLIRQRQYRLTVKAAYYSPLFMILQWPL